MRSCCTYIYNVHSERVQRTVYSVAQKAVFGKRFKIAKTLRRKKRRRRGKANKAFVLSNSLHSLASSSKLCSLHYMYTQLDMLTATHLASFSSSSSPSSASFSLFCLTANIHTYLVIKQHQSLPSLHHSAISLLSGTSEYGHSRAEDM